MPEQEVDEDATVTYRVLPFKDEENDAAGTDLTYEAKLVVVDQNGDESLLDISTGHWIKFDDDPTDDDPNDPLITTFRTFTFTPEAAHVGSHTLRVKGTDAGDKSDFVEFDVVVSAVNDAPKPPTAGLDNQEVDEDATVTYRVPAFTDEETSVLAYTF